MAVPPANAVHLAIGSVYAYSMWTPGMTQALGVVSASSLDWTHAQVLPVFSASAIGLGLTTATLGSWVEKVGPRKSGVVGSAFWSAALMTTGAGVHYHSIEMVYLGWGFLGGIGWGLMYLAPVTTVMKWFPDRRGLATGLALSAFGAGAAIAPSKLYCVNCNHRLCIVQISNLSFESLYTQL
jgi:MFS family permease